MRVWNIVETDVNQKDQPVIFRFTETISQKFRGLCGKRIKNQIEVSDFYF